MRPVAQYETYRGTYLAWLPQIPSHWNLVRPKTIFRKMQRPVRPEDGVVTCFRDGTVTLRKNRRTTGFTEAIQEIGYQGIRKGDLVIHAMDAFAGAIGVSDSDGKGTPVYAVCQPTAQADASYFALALREMSRSGYLLSLAKGIRERSTDFRYADFAALRVPLPPRAEQEQIVRFIRHLDQRVNRLIKAKRRLIELLNEQKQAIIRAQLSRNRAQPQQIGFFARVGNGSTPLRSNASYWSQTSDGYPWLNSASVNQGIITSSNQFVTAQALKECHLPTVEPDSILIAITGQGKTRGTAALLRIQATINQHLAYIALKTDRVLPEYLHLALSASYQELRNLSESSGSTKAALTCQDIKKFKIAIPELSAQQQIVTESQAESASIERASLRAHSEIGLITEYRARMVADIVTGQLDVRHVDLEEIEDPIFEAIGPEPQEGIEDETEVEEVEA